MDSKAKKDTKKEVTNNISVKSNKEIEDLKKQVDEYKNKYLRALADYQNYEKRVWEEKNQSVENSTKNVLIKLLPFLDNLEKAELFVKDNGLKLVKDNFYKILQEIGIEEINVVNKPFDPYFAEAVEVVEGKADGMIVGVLRKGYKFKDKIIRVAQVKVTKKISTDN